MLLQGILICSCCNWFLHANDPFPITEILSCKGNNANYKNDFSEDFCRILEDFCPFPRKMW